MSDRETTRAIRAALAERYCQPEWAAFAEVPASTGALATRSADLVAMSCYPSRGLVLVGVEIKASRSDWRRELKDPDKADAIARYCDRWFVAAPKDIVPLSELPENWGLLELTGRGLRERKAAPKLDAAPLDRPFVAAMLRRAAVQASGDITRRVDAATERVRAELEARRSEAYENRRKAEAYDSLLEKVRIFEEASGVSIGQAWGVERVGEAVALVQRLGVVGLHSPLANLTRQARTFADECERAVAELAAK